MDTDTQVHDSESMAAGICDIRFFQRDQPKMWKTLCRHQGNRWFTQSPMTRLVTLVGVPAL